MDLGVSWNRIKSIMADLPNSNICLIIFFFNFQKIAIWECEQSIIGCWLCIVFYSSLWEFETKFFLQPHYHSILGACSAIFVSFKCIKFSSKSICFNFTFWVRLGFDIINEVEYQGPEEKFDISSSCTLFLSTNAAIIITNTITVSLRIV